MRPSASRGVSEIRGVSAKLTDLLTASEAVSVAPDPAVFCEDVPVRTPPAARLAVFRCSSR